MRRPFACIVAALAGVWAGAAAAALPVSSVVVQRVYPHDTRAYTEGLFYLDGELFESTGMAGQSDVRRVRLVDGKVLQSHALDPKLFGEGVVNWGRELISLTWRDHIGYRGRESSKFKRPSRSAINATSHLPIRRAWPLRAPKSPAIPRKRLR